MLIYYFGKFIAALRWSLFRIFFSKSGLLNYVYPSVEFVGFKKINIGFGNVIRRYCLFHSDVFKSGSLISIGNGNVFSNGATLKAYGNELIVGNQVFLGERVQIQAFGRVVVSDKVMIAANTFISSSNHDLQDPLSERYLQEENPGDVYIGESVWIGANSIITAGVSIGDKSVIGAGSVVTKNIPPFSIALGNPAVVIKYYDKVNKKWCRANGI
ncbi:acyltransferase [Opacimonas viscosa]|uniref:Acyltransferase n=1 Tax=Opacimonas viscosa TaxID=2961944 RepID=A0AA41WZT4_9ALTE|nr:acyltransferase [Opacimonas viscosa]MCP3429120.1 acyltransferase [Opacimonas viscosa]